MANKTIAENIRNTIEAFDNIELVLQSKKLDTANKSVFEYPNLIEELSNTKDATATADDIISPKTAYINGEKVQGNIEIKEQKTLNYTYKTIQGTSNPAVFCNNEKYILKYDSSSKKIKLCDLSNKELDSISYSLSLNTNTSLVIGCIRNNVCYGLVCSNGAKTALALKIENNKIVNTNTISVASNNYGDCKILTASTDNPYLFASEFRSNSSGSKNIDIIVLNDNLTISSVKSISVSWSDFTRCSFFKNNSEYYVNYSHYGNTSNINTNIYKLTFNNNNISAITSIETNIGQANVIKVYNDDLTLCVYDNNLYSVDKENSKLTYNLLSSVVYTGTPLDIVDNHLITVKNNELYIYIIEKNTLTLTRTYTLSNSFNSYYINKSCDGSFNFYSGNSMDLLLSELQALDAIEIIRKDIKYYKTIDADSVSSDMLVGKVAYNANGKMIGTMPNNGTLNYTSSTEEQIIPKGYTDGGIIAPINLEETLTPDEYLDSLALSRQILTGELPFQQLEYIKCIKTGNPFDTGIVFTSNIWFDLEFSMNSTSTSQDSRFTRPSDNLGNSYFFIGGPFSGKFRFIIDKESNGNTSKALDTNKHKFSFKKNGSNYQMLLDDTVMVQTTNSFSTSDNLTLPRALISIYSFKVYNSGTLIRDFIPAKKLSNGKVCLYDLVTNRFYETSDVTSYEAGPEI